ncbi:1,4-alpha-glucan branching protein GlgB [uncultured Parolsenella sp.]|uniref:1,4-alpha-glucan branching protein GlgB n=1 Tax=uncultured Parolsenella sp. TaxID=2083008 RepID=UPI0025F4F9FC|nr:1,4-alpha-glucan branching protein GlgB [uncultured Parolsenella sp.]
MKATKAAVDPVAGASLDITSDDLYLMAAGTWYRSYDKMGAHPTCENGVSGYRFAVWAPGVRSVHVVGDFNGWDTLANPLSPLPTGGVWCGFVPGVGEGELYKFVLETMSGELLYKADPYAFAAELVPGTASVTAADPTYVWGDEEWLAHRSQNGHMHEPLNIYEVHLGSWKRHGDEPQGEPREDGTWPGPMDEFPAQRGAYYSYDDMAAELVPYVKEMGYSHVELLPVMEHPFDGSWGYQVTGYYAPTSRFGSPEGFMRLVDAFHQAGIGVILDWVPGGFCADAHGLAMFNGGMLYEREIHPNWGTHKFDFARGEVRSFLVSNALFWLERFHADGIRMDGVSSMLYLNFGIDNPAEKRLNEKGTEEDLDASAFIRQVNTAVGDYFPGAMMMAEESTAWPLVTYPPEDGGLGFHYKWDMGWMNDTLSYMQTDFPWRPGAHGKLTFSLMYAFNENFICPLSHDEVVHGKCSLITRQPGDQWRQFAGLRTLAFYQMTHPGAKLNFMGNEIGQYIEWRYYESIQWFLSKEYEPHAKHQHFIAALNKLYLEQPALWREAYEWQGFEWLSADDAEHSIISFVRRGNEGEELVVVINFDVNFRPSWRVPVPREGDYVELFNSDAEEFGGSGQLNGGTIQSRPEDCDGRPDSVIVNVPPLGGMILRRIGPSTFVPEPKETVEVKPADKRARRASGPLPVKGKRAATQKSGKNKKRAAAPKASGKGKGKSAKANKADAPAKSVKGATIK